MTIIISKGGKNAVRVNKMKIEKERFLQEYIQENPESLPLYEIKEDIRPLIVIRELQTASGPIDALVIDEQGDLFLIETKLYKNPDKRLVVAQVLDYGASLSQTYREFDEFVGVVDKALSSSKGRGLQQYLRQSCGLSDDEVAQLLDNMASNLRDGSYKFVVLMDTLDARLKDLILFLNKNSNFAVFAVEVEYYEYKPYEIIRPRVFGTEVKPPAGGRRVSQRWDEKTFFADASEKLSQSPSQVDAIRKLYQFSLVKGATIAWGGGMRDGSFNPKFETVSARSLYTVTSSGFLRLNFLWLNDSERAEKVRDELRQRVGMIQGLTIPEDYRERMVQFPPEVWTGVVDDLVEAFDSVSAIAQART